MLITWADIEKHLKDKGASANEINSKRQIFNNGIFQNLLLTEFGYITEKTFGVDDGKQELAVAQGTLDDLSSLDTYDLIDYIENHEISFAQASTILPQQMALLADDQIDKISNSLIEGLEDNTPISFALSHVVQTGFPYQKVKGKQHFERVNGALTVTMSAPNEIGLPSGIYPRLIFIHICSEIIKNPRERVISLGHSLKKFVVDTLNKQWTTGKRGTSIKWQETLVQLLGTSFTSTYKHVDDEGTVRGLELENVSIAKRAKLWWDDDYDKSMGATIEVSEAFAEALTNHATPLDSRAIKELADLRSPLAIDLYMWLTYRYYTMEVSHQPITRIRWDQLHGQMGTSIETVASFRAEVRRALGDVKRVYPSAKFSVDRDDFLVLVMSPPHVSPARVPKQAALDL